MSGRRRLLLAIACLLRLLLAALASLATLASAADVPYLSGRVVDDAQLLSPAARERIASLLKAHEDKTTNQLVVLTVPTLDGESIEPYATRVFETWKPGQKGRDNGALLIVVPKERKIRIEVGYGLEGVLTDAATSRIIRNVLAPRFKASRFDEGTEEGVAAIIALLQGDASAAGTADGVSTKKAARPDNLLGIEEPHLPPGQRLLFGAFVFGVIGLFTVIGIVTPGMGWFLYLFLIPFWALFPVIAVGVDGALIVLGVYLVAYPALKLSLPHSAWYQRRTRTTLTDRRRQARSRYGGVTHSSGSWWSSSDSGGSSDSGSSFSGGGGDSGGGGSSGDF